LMMPSLPQMGRDQGKDLAETNSTHVVSCIL